MLVRDLVEELLKSPQDAVPVIGGNVVEGVLIRKGKVRPGSCPRFSESQSGQQLAIVFLAKTVMANGLVKSRPK